MIARSLALVVVSLVLAGCGASASGGNDDGPGLSKRDVTREGDRKCAFDKEFRAAVKEAGFEGEVGDYPADFDQVILHVGDQDYADSADSTDLFDVRGAYQICRYSIGDDVIAEGYLYYFGPTSERTRLEDAEAGTYAYEDVRGGNVSLSVEESERLRSDFAAAFERAEVGEPVAVETEGHRAAVAAIAARGDGASAAIGIEIDGYREDPNAPARTLTSLPVIGPGPTQQQADELAGSIATALGKR